MAKRHVKSLRHYRLVGGFSEGLLNGCVRHNSGFSGEFMKWFTDQSVTDTFAKRDTAESVSNNVSWAWHIFDVKIVTG